MTVPIWWPWPPVPFSWDSVWILMREPRKCTRQYEKIILSFRIRKILPAQKLWKRTNCSLHLSLMIGSIRCLYHYTTYTSAMWSHVEIVLRLASCSRGVQWVVLALAQWHPSPQVPSGTPPLPTTTSPHNGPCTQYTGPRERWASCYSF